MSGLAELARRILRRRDDTCLLVRVVLSVKPIRVYLILHQETPFVYLPSTLISGAKENPVRL
jgi:hypothetical protein